MSLKSAFLICIFTCSILNISFSQSCREKRLHKKVERSLQKWSKEDLNQKQFQQVKVDSFQLSLKEKNLNLYFAPELSYLPIREEDKNKLYSSISHRLGRKLSKNHLNIISNKMLVQDLVPNWARVQMPVDKSRYESSPVSRTPLVLRADLTYPAHGLFNNNIVLWPSHGYYYESTLDRWEYQRARLFGTVEDLHPTMYVLQYLLPMLENAGAEVFLPRERDTQAHEVVVDNDGSGNSQFLVSENLKFEIIPKGFLTKDTLFPADKPFEAGSSLKVQAATNSGTISYIPEIPARGKYAVYVSYLQDNSNSSAVEYVVHHLGGNTKFLVNQKMGGSTWVYLGTFDFATGKNPALGGVSINIKGTEDGFISADAVRFGGGMGNVARKPLGSTQIAYQWKQSGKPRYMEAARYYLQYSGAPDTLVYNLNKDKNDYTDDLQGRGEWVNYLVGSSRQQYRSSFNSGLNIPVDLSFALHSDAGTTPNDSTIGSLCIYSTEKNKGIYPNGQSKMTNRDLADMIQTQVVTDIHQQMDSSWTRRAMWDRGYSEAYRQVVPSLLFELLSHQNAADMRLSWDPRFRFTASRAMYKGMLKYLAFQQNRPYMVQPLPVSHFAISSSGNKTIRLSWKAVNDSLEETAKPVKYKVYQRIANGGFNNGVEVTDTFLSITLQNYDQIYSFKVTAINDGGESFPSEILSVGFKNETAPVILLVNSFDRVSGPAFFDTGKMAGIAWWEDQGVPYISEIGFTGNQYDFDRKSEWKDDDSPGWGASYGNMEGKIIPGNNFDFSYVHGEAILANGYSFIAVSDEVFNQKQFDVAPFSIVDVILGEEKTTPSLKNKHSKEFQIYTPAFLNKLKEIATNGNAVFISGAYSGTDLLNTGDSVAIKFAKDVLHFQWRTNHATTRGDVYATDGAFTFNGKFLFNTTYNPEIYTVEAPDAVEPEGKNAKTIFRYSENNSSAGVAYKGKYRSVVCGFPFETILTFQQRKDLMFQVLNFLKSE